MDLTPTHRVVLAVYADLVALGPRGGGVAHDHVSTLLPGIEDPKAVTLEAFAAAALELRDAGLLRGEGHRSYPLYTITPEGREALAKAAT